jgi:hypothetical protein
LALRMTMTVGHAWPVFGWDEDSSSPAIIGLYRVSHTK